MKRFLKWGFAAMFVSAAAICVVNDVVASRNIGIMPMGGPVKGEFETRKMACPKCGTIGKIITVNDVNGEPVENRYFCLQCKYEFEAIKK